MIALAVALVLVASIAGAIAWRWLSLRYPQRPDVEIDPVALSESLAEIDARLRVSESKLNALTLKAGMAREARA